jgi:hypothetical protein
VTNRNKMLTKIGTDFLINNYTNYDQTNPSIAANLNDNFLVAWTSANQDGSGSGIFAQLFSITGSKIGSEFQVNTYPSNDQRSQSITALKENGYLVCWESNDQDGSGKGVYGQLLDRSATKINGEFLINTIISSWQQAPRGAALEDNNFVICWNSASGGSSYDIKAQLYLQNGTRIGQEFFVNQYLAGDQGGQAITSLDNGRAFIVTWESPQDGSGLGIFGRIYHQNGTAFGSEFQINNYTIGDQRTPNVAGLNDDNYIVTWLGVLANDNAGISAQLFNLNTGKLGTEIQVNSYVNGTQDAPYALGLSNGNFIIAWNSILPDGTRQGVYSQMFDSSGAKFGEEFLINPSNTSSQANPALAQISDGSFTAVWQANQDGSGWGVYGQLYSYALYANAFNQSITYLQDGPGVAIPNLAVLSPLNSTRVTLTLSDPHAGSLNVPNNITSSYDSNLGSWQMTDTSVNLNNAFRVMQFTPAPSYVENFTISAQISDGVTIPLMGKINFTGTPTSPALVNNSLFINQGQCVTISSAELGCSPTTRPITYLATNLRGGNFQLNNTPANNFSSSQVAANEVKFCSDRSAIVNYDITANDNAFTLPTSSASVHFHNYPPIVISAPSPKIIEENTPFSFSLTPTTIFLDQDLDPLTFSLTSANGTNLPEWLQFDNTTLQCSGVTKHPANYRFNLTATDPLNASVSTNLDFIVQPALGNNSTIAAPDYVMPAATAAGSIAGLALIVGGSIGIWRYLQNSATRDKYVLANRIRSKLGLVDVDNFTSETGQRYLQFTQNLVTVLRDQEGIDATTMRPIDLNVLADDIATAAKDKISYETGCCGKSIITVSDLEARAPEIAKQVQKIRSNVDGNTFEMKIY